MAFPRRTTVVMVVTVSWLLIVSVLHYMLNVGRDHGSSRFRVGFLPVTCHLTCPVTHYINEQMRGGTTFDPIRFQGWPELKEAFLSHHLEASFILAPMAMALCEQGVPIKIVYLGHRDGTTMVVHKNSSIHTIADLRGRTVAVPNRFSNQRLIIFRALKQLGIGQDEVQLREIPPPDMPAALAVGAVDAIISGEPFMGQAEMAGYGRVLFLTKDVWPEFISCVLAVHEDVIRRRRPEVQELVTGIARSGKWLDQHMENRMAAAEFTGNFYYHQDPALLRFVLSKPPDRVKFTNLRVLRADFEEIQMLGAEAGVLKGTAGFEDYADPSFVPDESGIQPYDWKSVP